MFADHNLTQKSALQVFHACPEKLDFDQLFNLEFSIQKKFSVKNLNYLSIGNVRMLFCIYEENV